MTVTQCARGGHRLDQALWQHRIANPQAGKQRFGEGADIKGPVMGIEPLQTGGGLSGIMKFTVIVIFEDEGVVTLRPVDQLQSPLQWERCAGRKLMGWRDKNTPRRFGIADDSGKRHTLLV